MIKLTNEMTIGEKYDPAMQVKTEVEATEYFETLVQSSIEEGYSREEAQDLQAKNIGYYAAYFNEETRERVYRLYKTRHPVLENL